VDVNIRPISNGRGRISDCVHFKGATGVDEEVKGGRLEGERVETTTREGVGITKGTQCWILSYLMISDG